MKKLDDLQPLGVLAIMDFSSSPDRAAEVLRPRAGALDHDDALRIAAYLRSGELVLAIMEQTVDVLDSQFSTAGGSGIQTDGRFFWRVDAADYVEHYDMSVPADFVDFGRSIGWRPSELTPEQLRDADLVIGDFYRASSDARLWPNDE